MRGRLLAGPEAPARRSVTCHGSVKRSALRTPREPLGGFRPGGSGQRPRSCAAARGADRRPDRVMTVGKAIQQGTTGGQPRRGEVPSAAERVSRRKVSSRVDVGTGCTRRRAGPVCGGGLAGGRPRRGGWWRPRASRRAPLRAVRLRGSVRAGRPCVWDALRPRPGTRRFGGPAQKRVEPGPVAVPASTRAATAPAGPPPPTISSSVTFRPGSARPSRSSLPLLLVRHVRPGEGRGQGAAVQGRARRRNRRRGPARPGSSRRG
ncbi:hypothetical protein SAMN06272771_0079 [Streptomyces sp. Ag82_O1-12]|nr:hypothetical protein SAMN06272771_0079 [Streptomyces sp. Ag82_O1-12]SOD42836.1 hypothetical protein SAMN06272727_0069 [Streptomyces sp. Ag82_G6-1]